MDKLNKLKADYDNIPIPEELDFIVKKSLKAGAKRMNKRNNKGRIWASTAACAVALFVAGINISPTVADSISGVPVIGKLVKVLTISEYKVKEETYDANIKTPAIGGLENKELQQSLNEKYLEENKKLYEEFNKDIEALKAAGGGHMGVDSGYVVKTDNEEILSIGRYFVNIVGSSSTTFKYDTIDKKNQILITLPSLFKDESYIDIISENIKLQMMKQMEADENKIYWIKDEFAENFDKIKADQSFYINNDGRLMISFDKYEVAPGYMGVVEFEIPSGILSEVLVSNEYIK